MVPQADLRGDLQTKIPDGVTGLAASTTMVGSPHGTVIEHRTGPAEVAIEDRVERTTGRVVAAQYAMVDRFVSLRALGHQTFSIKVYL